MTLDKLTRDRILAAVERNEALALLQQVAVPSVTGAEGAFARFVAAQLVDAGVGGVTVEDFADGRPNVWGVVPGADSGPGPAVRRRAGAHRDQGHHSRGLPAVAAPRPARVRPEGSPVNVVPQALRAAAAKPPAPVRAPVPPAVGPGRLRAVDLRRYVVYLGFSARDGDVRDHVARRRVPDHREPGQYRPDTAALGVAETAKVEQLMCQLRDRGRAILLISHNLDQVFRVADRIAVLRRGVQIGVRATGRTSHNQIVSMITGLQAADAA